MWKKNVIQRTNTEQFKLQEIHQNENLNVTVHHIGDPR